MIITTEDNRPVKDIKKDMDYALNMVDVYMFDISESHNQYCNYFDDQDMDGERLTDSIDNIQLALDKAKAWQQEYIACEKELERTELFIEQIKLQMEQCSIRMELCEEDYPTASDEEMDALDDIYADAENELYNLSCILQYLIQE